VKLTIEQVDLDHKHYIYNMFKYTHEKLGDLIAAGKIRFVMSTQAAQDMVMRRNLVSGDPIDPAIAEDWCDAYKQIESMNFDDIVEKYNVRFMEDDEGYLIVNELGLNMFGLS
jgi:hypothetical protein